MLGLSLSSLLGMTIAERYDEPFQRYSECVREGMQGRDRWGFVALLDIDDCFP